MVWKIATIVTVEKTVRDIQDCGYVKYVALVLATLREQNVATPVRGG